MALASTKPTKFTAVRPGSTIRVIDVNSAYEPFEASVLELIEEYGPQHIPALVIKADHNPEPLVIVANGATRVEILLDSGVLTTTALPAGAVRGHSIPIEIDAVQFHGGGESAMQVIQFCGGLANTSYRPANDQQSESIAITKLGEEIRLEVGDWMVRSSDKVWPEKPNDFATKYDVA